jgi:spore coat polysaccharide biosynthesis protein SpsF
MHAVAIVQARMGSTRLPGKVLRPLVGRPMLWHIVDRLRHARGIAKVGIATSDKEGDRPLREFCAEAGIDVFAGDEQDVLDRFYRAAVAFGGDPLIRITADCPFVDPELIEKLLAMYAAGEYDHIGVATGAVAFKHKGARYPDGLDAECIRLAALERAHREASERSDREHVTPYLYRFEGRFRNDMLLADEDHGALRWTVDHEADFRVVQAVYEALWRADRPFVMRDILGYFAAHPELRELNEHFVGHEGYKNVWNPHE